MSKIEERYKLIEGCYIDVVKYLKKFKLEEDAFAEAVQDTFVEAFSLVHTLRDESKVKGWIIKIARTQGLRRKRKIGCISTLESVFKEDVVQPDCMPHHEEDALKKLISKADRKELLDALMQLKEKERNVLILQYIYQEKLKDISLIVDESLTNTKTISRRAKEKLKKLLIEGGHENGE